MRVHKYISSSLGQNSACKYLRGTYGNIAKYIV